MIGGTEVLPSTPTYGESEPATPRNSGTRDAQTSPGSTEPSTDDVLNVIKDRMLGEFKDQKVMYKEGQLGFDGKTVYANRLLLDTGASSGSYIGQALVDRFPNVPLEPCSHRVRLGDNTTEVHITHYVTLEVSLYDEDMKLCDPIFAEFYVMPNLGDDVIIGLPDILGSFYDYFIGVLERARRNQRCVQVERLYQIYSQCREQICNPSPNRRKLRSYAAEAGRIASWYHKHKQRIKDSKH